MEILFEKCLRDILAKRGRTQRELAEHLSISTQAVSKWCRGENMPDITLLPKIASFLDVSVDELLGVGEIRKQEKIQDYRKKGFELARSGKNDQRIEMWREAYSEFPNDMAVNAELMYALYDANGKYHDEALALGERILRESTDEYQRSCAIQGLCFINKKMGNIAKAKEYASLSSSIHMSQDVLLSSIFSDDEEKVRNNLQLMLDCLTIIGIAVSQLTKSDDWNSKLWLYEFYLKLLDLYFDDGFYGTHAFYAVMCHLEIAKIYLSNKSDGIKALDSLTSAAKFAKQYDGIGNSCIYKSTLFNGYENHRFILAHNSSLTETEFLLSVMNRKEFDSIRDDERFKAIINELEA